jgi:hypothetical protein
MRYRVLFVGMLLGVFPSAVWASEGGALVSRDEVGDEASSGRHWLDQDLRLRTGDLLRQRTGAGRHLLVCRGGFAMTIAGRRFAGQDAVVRIASVDSRAEGVAGMRYHVEVYLRGSPSLEPVDDSAEAPVEAIVLEPGKAAVVRLNVDGELYVTADAIEAGSPQGLLLYREAIAAFESTGVGGPGSPGLLPVSAEAAEGADEDAAAGRTVGWAPLTEVPLTIQTSVADGVEVTTIMGRVYVWWQEEDEPEGRTRLIELQADNLVIWRHPDDPNRPEGVLSSGQHESVGAIYVSGDVQLREGQRTVRAAELYYDLRRNRGLARDAVLRTFDVSRDIPIYIRAAELRQMAANEFEAGDVTVTTSEFHTPQISVSAGTIRVVDNTADTEARATPNDSRFDAELEDVRFKYYDTTLLAWPSLRPNLVRPDVPLQGLNVGQDSTYGTSIETRWFLSRILGLREPEGTESTLALDYYSKRGVGGGVDITYQRETYFGRLLGYAIDDHGTDRLSRTEKDVEVTENPRGRFAFQHRHFLPYSWQLTAEVSYLSDENFLQQFYRGEFNAGKEQETLLHLKRIEDNWGLALLGKARVNDFLDKVEEQPSAEFHWTGQSLFDDRLTFYSDNQISRYRYLYAADSTADGSEDFFTFTMTRNEVDLPLKVGQSKIVPFVAGTFGYEDGGGFQASLDGSPVEPQKTAWIGEGGVRMATQPFWRVYPSVESRFWDLYQLRHVIRPHVTAVAYAHSDLVEEQRDALDVGVSQRWQTKRGPVGNRRTVDWFRLDIDFVWVSDSGDETAGPDQFIWNKPFIPLVNRSGGVLLPQDRRATGIYGPRRNYFGAEMALRLSDTTSILGDMNIDMQSGVAQQIDVGFARLCWPNLSYYIGSRYLRRIESGDEQGSNAVTFAATYVIDPRYTGVFAQQYDFDYGEGIRSDITLIRKYHRMNMALTVSADESLDDRSIVLSLWPQGVPELALGVRRYTGLGGSEAY